MRFHRTRIFNKEIQIIRSYLDKNIVQMVCEANEEKRKEKLVFKKYVESLLLDYIETLLMTREGSIDLETIFENDKILEKCRELVLNGGIFSRRKLNYLYQKMGNRKK